MTKHAIVWHTEQDHASYFTQPSTFLLGDSTGDIGWPSITPQQTYIYNIYISIGSTEQLAAIYAATTMYILQSKTQVGPDVGIEM